MNRPTFDLDVLRTLVTGIELGSFAKAADRLGRSTSAVSAQLKKLEEAAGSTVLRKAGRGMALTPMRNCWSNWSAGNSTSRSPGAAAPGR